MSKNNEVEPNKLRSVDKEVQRNGREGSRNITRAVSSSSSASNGSQSSVWASSDSTVQHNGTVLNSSVSHRILSVPLAAKQSADFQVKSLINTQQEIAVSPPVNFTNSNPLVMDDKTPVLDAELLQILGIDSNKIIKFGKDIQADVAFCFEYTALTGLTKEDRKKLTDKYMIPENCKLIGAPVLNPEVKVTLSETVTKRDEVIECKQTLMSSAISGLWQAINLVLSSNEMNTELFRILLDTGRALCDYQHDDTLTRRNFIKSSVNNNMKNSLQNAKIDDFLFGRDLSKTLKTTKAISRSRAALKLNMSKRNLPSTSNWKGTYQTRKQTVRAKAKDTTPLSIPENQQASSPTQPQNQQSSQNRR